MISEANICAGWESPKALIVPQINICWQMCLERPKEESTASVRKKHQVSFVMEFGPECHLTSNAPRVNTPGNKSNIPSTGIMAGNANTKQNPLLIQARDDGLIFALTRSRRSSLVAFLSGRSPLFKTMQSAFVQ